MKSEQPNDLSEKSAAIWQQVTAENTFGAHELPLLEAWLRWSDRSEGWYAEAQAATKDRERVRLLKQSLDAATAALRFRRALKFTDPGAATRRPGRPSDSNWSAKRKAQLREAI